ncbi:MAG: family 43 glycosylhydrolase [Candidatus Sumerlaeaceae bacterium]|nr:family 43 glycosylhydrolase [Candidatus Sumerlaeaceae bacterium]
MLRVVTIALLIGLLAPSHGLASGVYRNPLAGISNIGDPCVLHHGDTYYLYPTSNLTGQGPDAGVRVWTSKDLVQWTPRGWALLNHTTDWGHEGFVGPQVYFRFGQFFMLYAARRAPTEPYQICIARSPSPLGPFREWRAPLMESTSDQFDAFLLLDSDDRSYLYYASYSGGAVTLWVREIAPDLSAFVAPAATQVLGPPFSAWEVNTTAGVAVCEAPAVLRLRTGYCLTYSGNIYSAPDYAIGAAYGPTPAGPFSRFAGNPLLKANLLAAPPVSGPGSHDFVASPDGTEFFAFYNIHTRPATGGGDRSPAMNRVSLNPDGTLLFQGPTTTAQPLPARAELDRISHTLRTDTFAADPLTTPGSAAGWSFFGTLLPQLASADHEASAGAVRLRVAGDPARYRISGMLANQAEWLPYSDCGPERHVRAKYYVYFGGVADAGDGNQVPNLRLRVANRFAVSSMLEVFHHLTADPGNAALAAELRPSANAATPSLYTVDMDPVDVPFLAGNASAEGMLRGAEAYALEPQENGYIAIAESHIGVYAAPQWPPLTDTNFMPRVYQPSPSGAGSLSAINAAAEVSIRNLILSPDPGVFATEDTNPATPRPAYGESAAGITLDTLAVPADRCGIVSREFNPGPHPGLPSYVRVEEGRQYAVRFHITSTQQSNRQPQMRLRARAAKFAWSQKCEIGGAQAAGTTNNTIAAQALPGVGCQNPERDGNEQGGWYNLLLMTPLDPQIRPEFPPGAPLTVRMPLLASQPGPTVPAPSRRDLLVGFDIVDTISGGVLRHVEAGHALIDRIEIRTFRRVAD